MSKTCPNCGSTNVMGYALVEDYAYINLDDYSVDETIGEPELAEEITRFNCMDCDHDWDEEPEDIRPKLERFLELLDTLPKLNQFTHRFTFRFEK